MKGPGEKPYTSSAMRSYKQSLREHESSVKTANLEASRALANVQVPGRNKIWFSHTSVFNIFEGDDTIVNIVISSSDEEACASVIAALESVLPDGWVVTD